MGLKTWELPGGLERTERRGVRRAFSMLVPAFYNFRLVGTSDEVRLCTGFG